MDLHKPVVCLMGPTASGKSSLAIEIAKAIPCEIISVDSALVYRYMDIGTAKPDQATLDKYPHALVNIKDPTQSYSAAEFRKDALTAIELAHAQGKLPLLVGGTMLYFKALLQGLSDLPKADEKIRAKIVKQAQEHGWSFLHQRLQEVDPDSAKRINPKDKQRLQRALEIWQITGKTMTQINEQQYSRALPYRLLQLAIAPIDRSYLHSLIQQRFATMLKLGFVEEVESLLKRFNLNQQMPSMKSVGYRQIWRYLEGDCGFEQMNEEVLAATRQLAKRQLTWLRSWPDLNWLDSSNNKLYPQALKKIRLAVVD